MPYIDPDNNDPLGALIQILVPLMEADRAEGLRHGPTEDWLDDLALRWAKAHLPQKWGRP